MYSDDRDTGSGAQETGTSVNDLKVLPCFDYHKSETEKSPAHRPRKCRRNHHIRAVAQASMNESREAL